MNKKIVVFVLALLSTVMLMGAGGLKSGIDALRKDLNLSDVKDASTARTNLDVPSNASAVASLSMHSGDASDPHTDTLTQTNLTVASMTVSGYTGLGTVADGAPKIKMKKLTGTTASEVASETAVAHGLTSTKILSVSANLEFSPGQFVPSGYYVAEYSFSCYFNGTNILLVTGSGASSVLSKPVTILVIYEE